MPISKINNNSLDAASVPQSALATGVAGTGPAFSAYQGGTGQSISTNTTTKVLFDTEEFDTNNNFSSSRFQPTVAGYYQVNTFVSWSGPTWGDGYFYKNGISYKQFGYSYSSSFSSVTGSTLVYLNGSTDYIEVYLRFGSGQTLTNSAAAIWFNGALVRAA